MSQQPGGIGDLGSGIFFSSSSTLTSDPPSECTDNRSQTSRPTNDTSSTLGRGVTIDGLTTSDIVIAVMGPTGAGKSTFINMASGTQQATVGHKLISCTQEVQQISYVDEGRGARIVLVDTPGFDDTNLSDLEILRRISEWLEETHGQGILLSGILLFHRISDTRMGGTPLGIMEMFQHLCGKDALSNVMLVTTMWDDVTPEQGQQREGELRDYWKPMLAHGARMSPFRHTQASAHAIISHFQGCRRSLLIQDQMKGGKAWYETSAATTLFGPLANLIKKISDLIRRLDQLIRKEKDPVKLLKLSRKRERRESSLSDVLSTLQRRSSTPPTYPFTRPPPVATAFPYTVPGDRPWDSPASLRSSDLRCPVASPSSARSHDSLGEQMGALKRLHGLIPVSTLQDSVHRMLSIIETIEQLDPSDETIVPLVERTGLLTISFADHVQGQPSVDGVKHTIDQFQKLLSQMQDQLQVILTKRRGPREPTSPSPGMLSQPSAQAGDPTAGTRSPAPPGGNGTPDTVPQPPAHNDLAADPQIPAPPGGNDTADPLQGALMEITRRIEALLHEIHVKVSDRPYTINISGGRFFNIRGGYHAIPRPQAEHRPNMPSGPQKCRTM